MFNLTTKNTTFLTKFKCRMNLEKSKVLYLFGDALPEVTELKVNGLSASSSAEQLSVWLAARQPG